VDVALAEAVVGGSAIVGVAEQEETDGALQCIEECHDGRSHELRPISLTFTDRYARGLALGAGNASGSLVALR
jgi:hypothetical protein